MDNYDLIVYSETRNPSGMQSSPDSHYFCRIKHSLSQKPVLSNNRFNHREIKGLAGKVGKFFHDHNIEFNPLDVPVGALSNRNITIRTITPSVEGGLTCWPVNVVYMHQFRDFLAEFARR
ncbi:MAG: hypothetical protein AABW79_02710 [Nanoarchaeota archaeon]